MLSGLVYCGAVEDEEHSMHIETIPAKKGKRGKYVYFICTTKKNTRNDHCQAGRVSLRSLEQSVIENVLEHILTLDTLQPLADEIAGMLTERSDDAGTRINAIEQELCELRKSMGNLLDAIERMGYTPHLQDRYNERQREEAGLMTELATLEVLYVEPDQIDFVTKDMLRDWINHTRETLEGGDSILARHALRQFIAKIVIKEKTGTIYYTFPLDVEMSSFQKVDLMIVTMGAYYQYKT